MNGRASWKSVYRELIETIAGMGYPEEFGKAIAGDLGYEKAIWRMTAYLRAAKPRSAEEIADEMLAIKSANVKHFFTSLGNEFFTLFGKQFFTLSGNEFFTLYGKQFFTLPGKEFFTSCQIAGKAGRYLVN